MARADEAASLCRAMRQHEDGGFAFRAAGAVMEVVSRRPLSERDAVGRASLKGALARRLARELGAASVRWSGAEFRGPYGCGSYKVLALTVDPLTFKLGEAD